MAAQCDECGQSFKNDHGVTVHKYRSKICGGGPNPKVLNTKTRTSTRKSRRLINKNGETGKEAVRRILSEHPQGLPVEKIFTELRRSGFKLNRNYVTSVAVADASIVRVERGIYRLMSSQQESTQQSGAAVVREAIAEVAEMPREALLLRIEILEANNRALHDAHLCLMKGKVV